MKCIYCMPRDKYFTLSAEGSLTTRQHLLCFVLDEGRDIKQFMQEYSYLKMKCNFKPDSYIVVFNTTDRVVSKHRTGWNVTLCKHFEKSKVEKVLKVTHIAKGEHMFKTIFGDGIGESIVMATAPVSKVKEAQSYAGEVRYDSYQGFYVLYPMLAEHCILQSFISEEMYNDFIEGRITSPYVVLLETKLYQLQLIKQETISVKSRDFKVAINNNVYVLRMYDKEKHSYHTLTKAYSKLYSWRSLFDF